MKLLRKAPNATANRLYLPRHAAPEAGWPTNDSAEEIPAPVRFAKWSQALREAQANANTEGEATDAGWVVGGSGIVSVDG